MDIGDLGSVAAAGVAVIAACIAWMQAMAGKRQAAAAADQLKEAMAQSQLAEAQLQLAQRTAAVGRRQAEAYEGAQAATAWRDQVFTLHDRGLTPGQIRFIMHLEDGGIGYEAWNGPIDDVVAGVTRTVAATNSVANSCEPLSPGVECTGPCRALLRSKGYTRYRKINSMELT